MERFAGAALLLALGETLSGCYESSRPLARPGAAYDRAVLGQWNCVPDPLGKPDDRATLMVWPFDESQYYAEWTEGPNTTRYRAFGSRIGTTTLLNVREMKIGSDDAKWAFVRYRFEGDRLRIAVVKDDAVHGGTEAAKLEDIRRRAAGNALYQSFAVCSRPPG